MSKGFEFYETPETFTRYLFNEVPITGHCFEPCVGDEAIVRASDWEKRGIDWTTNDLDRRWKATYHADATEKDLWKVVTAQCGQIDWTISNTAFSIWLEVAELALQYSRIGVALHLRASVHEVLKTGPRRSWMADHTPTGILWLPRFAYQRSPSTGKWTTDSVCANWVIWLRGERAPQFIRYAPEWVIDALDKETPAFRARMDTVMAARGERVLVETPAAADNTETSPGEEPNA